MASAWWEVLHACVAGRVAECPSCLCLCIDRSRLYDDCEILLFTLAALETTHTHVLHTVEFVLYKHVCLVSERARQQSVSLGIPPHHTCLRCVVGTFSMTCLDL